MYERHNQPLLPRRLGGMGPVGNFEPSVGKVFAALYAL